MNLDPRPSVIEERLKNVKRIIAVTGWKGGIGKSVTASTLALLLARKGYKTGLFDLDFAGASDHLILGAKGLFPKEEKGLEPPVIAGVKFMSVVFFSADKAVPLRGANVSDAIIELLAITQWGELDFLVLDMPPGINDAALDVIRFMRKTQVLAVTTPSMIARSVLQRSLALYKKLKVPVLGVLENMSAVKRPAAGALRLDAGLEKALGRPAALLKTAFARDLALAAPRLNLPVI
ncbi:MAG: ATP-binding protein [Elusimicrobia bacterium RIFOXYA2_FULL_58_8]|nr:MAG: ATP-binding protein [Elusimicrobia bacterium RIFOXYA2_FULL_58_8]